MATTEFTGGSRMVNGVLQTANPGYGWDANGNYVNISQAQLGQQAQTQAQQDLAGFGSPSQIADQGAAAADPFASQRPQYQNDLKNLMSGNFSINDPSYKFRFDQGQQAVERSEAAKGMLGSGNILQELQKYGQGMGSQEYQNQYNRLLPLTGATTGSPAASGAIKAGVYNWRNNALADLGAGIQMQTQNPYGAGGLSSSGSSLPAGRGGSVGGGISGGGGGSSSGGGGSSGGGFGGDSSSFARNYGTTAAESDAALSRQLAGGGGTYYGGAGDGGGFINAVPVGGGSGEAEKPRYAISNSRGPDGKYYIKWSDGSTTLG